MVTSSQRNDKRLHSVQLWEIRDSRSLCVNKTCDDTVDR